MDGKTNRDKATEHAEKAFKMKCMSAGGKGFLCHSHKLSAYLHATIKVAFL